jgi:DNA helicase-2/ATP-dependent DNA helicase PcrA
MKLTENQTRVAKCLDATIVVMAAVGSGKTTTLSERVALAVQRGVPPSRILALTFTNRAATRMRESLTERDAVAASRVHVHTFHGLCMWILRTEARTLGLSPSLWIHDEEDSEDLLKAMGVPDARNAMFRLHGEMSAEALGAASLSRYATAAFSTEPWAARYLRILSDRGAVDFSGLVYLARAALSEIPEVSEKWGQRFDWIQVDEVQDTHMSEYDVIRHLSAKAQSLCLVGDLDQTIYGWRGSHPKALLAQIEKDRGMATNIMLSDNFRSTKALIHAANIVASGLHDRATQVQAAAHLADGTPPEILSFHTPDEEALGIARHMASRLAAGISPKSIAVLCRANWLAVIIARALAAHQIPHTTVESFKFFRRMEIKDALALLKLVVDRDAPAAAHRVSIKMVKGVGKHTLSRLRKDGAEAGLRLVDMLDTTIVDHHDPLWGLDCEDYVVLDTETTGIDPHTDEVIEVGAIRVRCGEMTDSFQALIQPTGTVGDSQSVHGISDAQLAEEGRDPAEVFAELQAFIGDTPIAGHNLRFDIRMLTSHSARLGTPMALPIHFDSLRYARRLLKMDSYRLGDLATALDLEVEPTHRAIDDVKTTVLLLKHLATLAAPHRGLRRQIMQQFSPTFSRLRTTLDKWAATNERPGVLIHRILHEGGLLAFYRKKLQGPRLDNLGELSARIAKLDNPKLEPIEATRHALDSTALAREQDLLDDSEGVRVITIHQAKGLEFDHVYVPGMVDGKFPSWHSIKANDTEEDRRVFYVALTRAKKTLTLSHYDQDRSGPSTPSRFLAGLRPKEV